MRRSYMSAIAPAGIEISMTGSITAVCTSATMSADAAISVIAQAAPTPWISEPKLESRFAPQTRRNWLCRSGAATSCSLNMRLPDSCVSVVATGSWAGEAPPFVERRAQGA